MNEIVLARGTPTVDVVAYGRVVLGRNGKSFRFASAFLPRGVADDAAILYAFCREVDDAVDEAPSAEEARRAGARLAEELSGDAAPRLAVAAFLQLAARRGIDLRYARDLLAGVRADAEGPVRIFDDDELLTYGYRVAGTVGAMMCPLLGVDDPRALPSAIDLGIAMQITNICRDVLEDLRHDRVYLPATRLRAAGLEPDDLVRGDVDRAALASVVRDLLRLADRFYDRGDAGMRFIPLRARVAILVASRVYREIGVRLLERHGGDPLHGRTVVPLAGKLVAALRAVLALPALPAFGQALPERRSRR